MLYQMRTKQARPRRMRDAPKSRSERHKNASSVVTRTALQILKIAAEGFYARLLQESRVCAAAAKRSIVTTKDVLLARRMCSS